MVEEEDTRLTHPHKHIKTTTANRATLPEINLGTSKTALLQPKLGRKSYTESGRRRGKAIWLNLHPLAGDTEETGITLSWGSFLGSEGFEPHIRHPTPGI